MNQDQLLHEAMVPLGEMLDPLGELISGERNALIVAPTFLLILGGLDVSESPDHLKYFLVLCLLLTVFLYFGTRRYFRLKKLYHKIEDWPYTSKEALVEAHAAISSHLSKLKSLQWVFAILPFISSGTFLTPKSREFLRELFLLNLPRHELYVYGFILLIIILVSWFGRKNYNKTLNQNYREPLSRLQEIIDCF